MKKEVKPVAKVYKLPKTNNYFVWLWEFFTAFAMEKEVEKKKEVIMRTYMWLFKGKMPEDVNTRVDPKIKKHLLETIKNVIKKKQEETTYCYKMIESNEKEVEFFKNVLSIK